MTVYIVAVLLLSVLAATTPLQAKHVYCIDHDPADEDGFLTSAEGWIRANADASDVISLDGSLTDCLAMVEDGDQLTIVAHAADGGEGFEWGGTKYYGFGGTDMPVPPNFNKLQAVSVHFVSCWSDDPEPLEDNLLQKILEAMGGPTNENTGRGYAETVKCRPTVVCGTNAPMTDAEFATWDSLINVALHDDESWVDYPPPNRSDPAPIPNQLTKAREILEAADIINPKPMSYRIEYSAPYEVPEFAEGGEAAVFEVYCEVAEPDVICENIAAGSIPTLSEWGFIMLVILLFAWMGWMIWRRRRPVTAK